MEVIVYGINQIANGVLFFLNVNNNQQKKLNDMLL